MCEGAAQLIPDSNSHKPQLLNNLGVSLLKRFEQHGNLDDIERSITVLEDCVQRIPENHINKSGWLSNLGNSIARRFQKLGNLKDLNKSLSVFENAVLLSPAYSSYKCALLCSFGTLLQDRFCRLGDLSDINKSVLILQDAMVHTPDDHPQKSAILNNLGNSLRERFLRLGNLHDINEAILMLENDLHLTHGTNTSSLGVAFATRYENLGDLSDLNRAISLFEDLNQLTADSHPDKSWRLNHLGNVLQRRFERLGDLHDLDKSISLFRAALQLTPDEYSRKAFMLNNIGTAFKARFDHLKNPSDLNASVSSHEEAVQLIPDNHPDKALNLNSLASSLQSRFRLQKNINDITRSILLSTTALVSIPDGHPDRPLILNTLGNSFLIRFKELGDEDDHHSMITHFSSAACSPFGPAHIRFHTASMWAENAQKAEHPSVLNAYQVALDLLPQVAWLGLSIIDRHHHLLRAGKVVRDAVAAAITASEYDKAVEWLEQGRSVIWGQLLNLRTPLDDLKHSHPSLAEKLQLNSLQLEGAGTRDNYRQDRAHESLQSIAEQYHDCAQEREQLLREIRALKGFSGFLMPKKISEISLAAQKGHVVVLNISQFRCDALIVMRSPASHRVRHVSLQYTLPKAEHLQTSLGSLVGNRLDGKRENYVAPGKQFEHILSELWLYIVKPVVSELNITSLQHIWWCPTGPLAFLPIHAAGLYGANEVFGSKLSDFVISSYTPSLTALINVFQSHSQTEKLQLLAVAQPSASGQVYIPGTRKEIAQIQKLAPSNVTVLRLEEDNATLESVEEGMKKSNWVHFACHGTQDISNPTESALLLAGSSRLKLSSIIKLALPHADLAFLSACQTATGDKALQEEAVHLAAGMLLSGYHGVIATMWSIMDEDAPQIAGDFYGHLFQTSPPDSTRAAEALHLAVQNLREKLKESGKTGFFNWVSFIHVG
ncbi:CHAT domain-containing protein, partial [Mycena leptocephala]